MIVCGKYIKVQGRLMRLASPELDSYEDLADPETMLDGLRKSGARIDLFTFMQLVPDTTPKYAYSMEWDNLAVIPLTDFDHWWKSLRSEARNRARQAEKKGVTLREVPFESALVQGIWEVYNETPVRQGRPNTHYGKDIETVRREEETFLDRSIFIGAFLGEQLIGFVKLVTDEGRTHANLMNIVAMIKHRDKAPTNALIAQSVRACEARGIRYLTYQNFAYGKKKGDSLANFKEVNGFKRFDVPRYYVPLTAVGQVALRLGLHHRFIDRLPEPLVAKVREFRTAWYNRKLQSATEAS
jgi:hypothetical protein